MKYLEKKWIIFLKSLLTLYALFQTFTLDTQLVLANHLIGLFVFYVIFISYSRTNLKHEQSLKVLSHIFASFYSLALVLGSQLYLNGYITYFSPMIIFKVVFIEIFFSRLLMFSALKIKSFDFSFSMRLHKLFQLRWIWLIVFMVFVSVWSIYWLSYYPGIVDIDNTFNFMMYNAKEFTTHHPILHISMIGFLFNLGNQLFSSFNHGVSIYIIVQILITALCLTWCLRRLFFKNQVSGVFIFLAIIIYSGLILPIIPMNVITTTKDMLFSAFLFAFFILNYDMAQNFKTFMENQKDVLQYLLFGFLILALRNNALYALTAFTLILFIYSVKMRIYKNILLVLVIIGTFTSYSFVTTNLLNIKDVSSVKEMSSVPLQQLARTYNRSPQSLSQNDKNMILNIVGPNELSRHNPYWSDFVKIYFNQDHFLNNKQAYINLYFKLLADHPTLYLDSFLENTLFSWYPFSINEPRYTLYGRNLQTADSSLLFITTINSPAIGDSILPNLKAFLENISTSTIVFKFPIYAHLYSIGFMFWLFLYSVFLNLYRKKWNTVLYSLLILLYTLTLWLGPVMFIRYFLYFWLLIPLTLHDIFDSQVN